MKIKKNFFFRGLQFTVYTFLLNLLKIKHLQKKIGVNWFTVGLQLVYTKNIFLKYLIKPNFFVYLHL